MRIKPTKILWPTDFSDVLESGRYAAAFAEQFDAQLHVLNIVQPMPQPELAVYFPQGVDLSGTEKELVDSARSKLRRVVEPLGLTADRIVCHAEVGSVWNRICDYAAEQDIDLIILSTHGLTGLRHVLIGSIAERVVQHAPCPVLTVKSAGHGFVSG